MALYAPQAPPQGAYFDPWVLYDNKCLRDRFGNPRPLWEPTDPQLEWAEDHSRHQVIPAGRRTGKSNYGAHRALPYVFIAQSLQEQLRAAGKRVEIWVVGPEYSDGEKEFRVFYNACVALGLPFDKPGTYNNAHSGDMRVSLWQGAFVLEVKSAKYPDQLVGEELTFVILAEAAKLKPAVWTKYIRPMLADQSESGTSILRGIGGRSLHTSTPEGKNHFYDKYLEGQKKASTDWYSKKVPSWHNYTVYGKDTSTRDVFALLDLSRKFPTHSVIEMAIANQFRINAEILALMEELTVEAFLQEIAAEFTEYVGKVFKDFDANYHVGQLTFHPEWETFAAIDYGFRNPNVWLLGQMGPNGEINFLDEVYEKNLTINDFAKEIRRRNVNPSVLKVIYPDPSAPDDTQVLMDELKVTASGNTGGELRNRLDLIRRYLKKGVLDYDGVYKDSKIGKTMRPAIMFDYKCPRTVDDFEKYRYPETKDEARETNTDKYENPLKVDDHGPEAVGRFFAGRFGTALTLPQEEAVTRISRARVGRGTGQTASGLYVPPSVNGKPLATNRVGMHESDGYEYKKEPTYYD